MTSTELVRFDPVFARFQTHGIPILHAPLPRSILDDLSGPWFVEPEHDVDWRFYEPDLDDLEGLDYWDRVRELHPQVVDNAAFLDSFEHDHVVETGHLPRARWYRDARQRQRQRRALARQRRLTREWAAGLDGGTFTMGDADDSTCSGTEEFSDSVLPAATLRVKTMVTPKGTKYTAASAFDDHGNLLGPAELVFSRQTVERYRDTSVAETAIFHPNKGDGLTLDEMLAEMRRFEVVDTDDQVGEPAGDIDPRYDAHPEPAVRIRKLRAVVELADLRARAVEICRFPWSDDRAAQHDSMARGWVRRSRLLEWGSDTWQVIVTRKCYPVDHDPSHPRARNHWTVFVRTHTGSETVRRANKPDLQVWTWTPHYYQVFGDEEQATSWLERLEAAFLRERHGDLDMERWPQDLVNDRSVAASQAAQQWKLWHTRNRDGWKVMNLDGNTAPGALTFEPEQPQTWDPAKLQERLDAEFADYEAAQ